MKYLKRFNESSFFDKEQLDSIYVLVDKIKNDNNLDFIRSLCINKFRNRVSGNIEMQFYYDYKHFRITTNDANSYYSIYVNSEILIDTDTTYKTFDISKTLYNLLLKYTRTKFYSWYNYFMRYLEVHLKTTRSEIYEKIEEFEILKDKKLDFISLESLFDYYNINFSKDEMIKWFRDYADKVDLTELVLNESVNNNISSEIISYLKEDPFLLSSKLYIIYAINDEDVIQYKFTYENNTYIITYVLLLFYEVNPISANKEFSISREDSNIMIDLLSKSKTNRDAINNIISHLSNSSDLDKIKEIKERMIEFDVIKDNKVDLINLNQIFDYYGKSRKFDLSRMQNYLDTYEIKYIS